MPMRDEMPTDIERIVDRKLIKQRVHYFVVWKGFSQENNTWESRIDLMADGYSGVIKRFEDQRKKESGSSTPRGRSPGRSTSKSPRKSKSPGRGPGRRSRSRSASVGRKLLENDEDKEVSKTSTTTRRRKSVSSNENNEDDVEVKETPKRRSTRKQVTETTSTQFVSRLDEEKADPVTDEEDDSLLLRSTIAALAPQVREMAPPAPLAETEVHKKPVALSYEDDEETGVLLKSQSTKETSASETNATVGLVHEHASPVQEGFIAKALESGYLASFLSVAAVVGSLVASQMLPHDEEEGTDLWRRWLAFLTPVVALLVFFHQKDARVSAKWVATGLAWRAAAELLLLIGATPRDFENMVAGSAVLANVSLLIAFVSIIRNGEHVQSKATLGLLATGVLGLFLSDSWVISTENSELESRVILMSMAVLTIALSPMPTVSSENDD